MSLRHGIGSAVVSLPDDVNVDLSGVRVSIGERHVDLPDPEDIPEGAPTLSLRARNTIGELRLD